ncbi:MAG: oxygenase MpaB family protein [Thermoflexibacter sp.]
MQNFAEYLEQYRYQTDALADKVIQQLFQENYFHSFNEQIKCIHTNQALDFSKFPEYVQVYFKETMMLPDWADTKKMQAGSEFFNRNADNIILLLSFLSLPYCYANASGSKVLSYSQRIANQTQKRLYETAQFVFHVTSDDAFEKNGAGFISIQKVRLMHATIRYYINKSNRWDTLQLGEPVNQEDLAMTHLSFSFIVLQGLRKIGVSVSKKEADAYLHLWKVISFLLGVNKELLPDNELEAQKLDLLIQQRQFKKSDEGIALCHALFTFLEKSMQEAVNPLARVKGFVSSYARFVLGEKLADLLAIPAASWSGENIAYFLKLSNGFQDIFSTSKPSRGGKDILNMIYKTEGKTDFSLPIR